MALRGFALLLPYNNDFINKSIISMKKLFLFLAAVVIYFSITEYSFSQTPILRETFNSATFPPTGWAIVNGGSGNNWVRNTSASYLYEGAGSMQYQFNSSNPANTWAFTSGINMVAGNEYYVVFYQSVAGAIYPENLKVTVGAGQTIAAQTTTVGTYANLVNTTFQRIQTSSFTAPSTGVYNFAFNCYSAADMFYLNVDSVNVYEVPGSNMAYLSSTTFSANINNVPLGTNNQLLIGVQIVTSGTIAPFNLTTMDLNTNGSTDPSQDILNARIYYTGTVNSFSPINQFGTDFNSPNGSFQITGTQQLLNGTNYFWLTYDISPSAGIGNFVDAECTQITMDGSGGTQTPVVTSPAGSRVIVSPLSGTVNVGTGETYTTLTGSGGLFEAVNNLGLGANLVVNVTSNITEPGTFALNQWSESGVGNYTLTIQPSSASEKIISGNVASIGMIRLDGADRVIIDGRFGGSGKYLRFRNTSTAIAGITFLNDATYNTVTYCIIESGTTTAQVGGILFSTTTGTLGNSNNIISYCDIRDRSDATAFPLCLIVSVGTPTAQNSNNTIDNCNLFNCYANGNPAISVYLSTGSTAWTVSNNSIYQTATRTNTVTNSRLLPIYITNSNGVNFNVSGNYIGGTAPLCGGTPLTYTSSTTGIYSYIQAISLVTIGTSTASTIQNNIIRNITLTTIPPNGASVFPWIGINASTGSFNITGNTIGSTTGNGAITINDNGIALTSTYGFYIDGMQVSPTGTCSITNNNVGSITLAGTNSSGSVYHYMRGILLIGTPTSPVSVSGNLIGSLSTTNSINLNMTTTTRPQGFLGIITSVTTAQPISIANNTIQNVTNNTTGTTNTAVTGISTAGTGTVYSITGNTIKELSSRSLVATTTPGTVTVSGIILTSTGLNQSISGNTISGLRSTTTNSITNAVYGITINATGSTGISSKNKIYDLTNTSTNTAARIYGTNDYLGANWVWSNNQISLTNGETSLRTISNKETEIDNSSNNNSNDKSTEISSEQKYITVKSNDDIDEILMQYASIEMTNASTTKSEKPLSNESVMFPIQGRTILPEYLRAKIIEDRKIKPVLEPINNPSMLTTSSADIQGFHEEFNSGTNASYYYNTVYIGGFASGTTNSYCFNRVLGAVTVNLRNNLFYNNRSGGTGSHIALSNNLTATGWSSTASNYNALVAPNMSSICRWNGTNATIDAFRTSSSGDKHTLATTNSDVTPSELFINVTLGNLEVNPNNPEAWFVNGKGIALSGQNSDFNGTARPTSVSGGTTDIGAFEISVDAETTIPPSAIQTTVPGSGQTSTYTVWNRTIAAIYWGENGTQYPISGMNVKYYSQTNPPNPVGGSYSNSYTSITPVFELLTGATYDITYYFGDNETYTIASPSVNTILAKYNVEWVVYPAGTNDNETELNWTNLTAKVRGLFDFSYFTLSDGSAPLPVNLADFSISTSNRDINLQWSTETEINNKGFSIERRMKTADRQYSAWKEVSFVNGKGNSTSRVDYTYTDKKLNSGAYQYRLKQIDYNGNYEYHSPANSADMIIGKPGSFDISQNYPNPSNPKSKIDFSMPFDGKVTIKVYDILGKEVASLINEFKPADFYTVEFDGSNISSGTYFYRIIAEGNNQKFTKTMKMILVK